jgi:shikimate kinase
MDKHAELSHENNIILIGMPGCGKSTVGVILAKILGYDFLDTDLLIQKQSGLLLHELLNKYGTDYFIELEESVNSAISAAKTVIATGGSVVYGEKAMRHLKSIGKVVYLSRSFDEISDRVGDLKDRGVVTKGGQTLRDIYRERTPLYEIYADITVNAEKLSITDAADNIIESMK